MPRSSPVQPAPARPRTWLEMRERIEKILERRTGEGIVDWLRQAYQANVTSNEKPSVSKGTP